MFSKLSLFVAASMAVFVAAGIENSCNTGTLQCCNSVQQANSPVASTALALVGVAVGDVTGMVGVTCSPITLIGVASGSKCTAQPACCTNNSFNGLVALGCSPVAV